MPTADITVSFVNYPKAPKKYGSIKSSEGHYYSSLPPMLRQFQVGEVCKVEYIETPEGYRNLKEKLGSSGAPAPKEAPSIRARSNPVDAENIFVSAHLKEFIANGTVTLDVDVIVQAVKVLREAYKRTLGGLENQRNDTDMRDEVQF